MVFRARSIENAVEVGHQLLVDEILDVAWRAEESAPAVMQFERSNAGIARADSNNAAALR
jgi:hypothetical protein